MRLQTLTVWLLSVAGVCLPAGDWCAGRCNALLLGRMDQTHHGSLEGVGLLGACSWWLSITGTVVTVLTTLMPFR